MVVELLMCTPGFFVNWTASNEMIARLCRALLINDTFDSPILLLRGVTQC